MTERIPIMGEPPPVLVPWWEQWETELTLGTSAQQTEWGDRRRLTWPALVELLTDHRGGPKEGACFVPAVFRGLKRTKHEAVRIGLITLDADAGHPFDEVIAALRRRGYAAVVHSTHSHLTTRARIRASNWHSWRGKHPGATPGEILQAEKGYLPQIVPAAWVIGEDGEYVELEHAPCPKFRVILPLARPWRAEDYPSQSAANAAWKRAVAALAHDLGLHHDQSCTDTSRLFYLPRHPPGAPFEALVVDGEPIDAFALPPAPAATPCGARAGVNGSGCADCGGTAHPGAWWFADRNTGEMIDLGDWVRDYGHRFEVVTALKARCPRVLRDYVADGVKHHVECPNAGAHTLPGGLGTFAVNASETDNRGFVIHCRHAHCTGKDRLFFLSLMLDAGWLMPTDLTDSEFLVAESERVHEMSVGSGEPGRPILKLGSDVELARRVAADFAAEYGEVVYTEGAFWRFVDTHWTPFKDHELRLAVHRYDGAVVPAGRNKMNPIRLTKARIDGALTEMAAVLAQSGFFDDAPAGINCISGFIAFDASGEPECRAHAPDQRCRHVLPGRWPAPTGAEGTQRSLLMQLLEGSFRGDPDAGEKIDLLAEVAGAAALGYGTRLIKPKAVVLKGEMAENGKSQILELLRGLLPPDAVSSLPPGRFGDERFVVHLSGKLLNAGDELSGAEAVASGAFKSIVTGDPVVGRDVYRSAVTFRPVAQHVFATNDLPTFRGGIDRGVQRRLLVVTFNRVIPEAERLEHIGRRVALEEPDLLLDWAVRGAARLIRRCHFAEPTSSKQALREWLVGADPVLAWLEESVTVVLGSDTPRVPTREAYQRFREWAVAEGFGEATLPRVNMFVQRLLAAGKGIERTRTAVGRYLVGLVIRAAGAQPGVTSGWRGSGPVT